VNTTPELPALHVLNSVFAGITGQDPYLVEQLKAGIEHALAAEGANPSPAVFASAVAALQKKLHPDGCDIRHGFEVCDAAASPAPADSLWTRMQVIDALKRLAPYPESTLLITNLQSAFCPPGTRWTPRRQAAYRDILDFIAALAIARKRERAKLTLLFM
jgi:hypothetical protein